MNSGRGWLTWFSGLVVGAILSALAGYFVAVAMGLVNPRYSSPSELACVLKDNVPYWFSGDAAPPANGVRVLVARFEPDQDGRQTHHVAESLYSVPGMEVQELCSSLRIARGVDASLARSRAEDEGRRWLKRHGAAVLVWGEVNEPDRSVLIRLLKAEDTGKGKEQSVQEKDYRLPEDYLEATFAPAVAAAVVSAANGALTQKGSYIADRLRGLLPRLRDAARSADKLPKEQRAAVNQAYGSALLSLALETGQDAYAIEMQQFEEMRLDNPNSTGPERADILRQDADALEALGVHRADDGLLRRAVDQYGDALVLTSRQAQPLKWAMIQNDLGNVLVDLGERESGTEHFEQAVAAFREASRERTRDRVPLDWADTQYNLGIALDDLGERESGTVHLEQAMAAYREALKEYSRDRDPLYWGDTQMGLGSALDDLGDRESGTEHIKDAVAAYSEALKVFTRDRVPLRWASAQLGLGTSLELLGERESGKEHLEQAAAAYRESLKEDTRGRVPLVWAATQNNLGNVLGDLGERESGTAHFEQAVEAYQEALKEWTRDRVPLDWARAESNLGAVLTDIGERESGTKHFEQAVVAYHEALKEWTRDRVPLDWATVEENLGIVLADLGKRINNADDLGEAAAAYRRALDVYASAHSPREQDTRQKLSGVQAEINKREDR